MGTALRHGHAGGHLREPFCEYFKTGKLPGDSTHDGEPLTAWRLAGLPWNGTDTLPGDECQELGIPRGSSYAQAAHVVRNRLRQEMHYA